VVGCYIVPTQLGIKLLNRDHLVANSCNDLPVARGRCRLVLFATAKKYEAGDQANGQPAFPNNRVLFATHQDLVYATFA
jgi:hypothetical protein